MEAEGSTRRTNREDIPDKFKIADIQFAFNNSKILDLLKKRGDAIKNADFKTVRKIEEKMTQVKNKRFDDINVPVEMYVTFYNEDTFLRCKDIG